jgi:transposase
MRGSDGQQGAMFSYVSLEKRVPADHPLRPIRQMADAALKELSPRFSRLYSDTGRPSIPPEQLLRALILQILYTVRSERMLIEQLDYNLLFRWFVGLGIDDEVWDATVFTKNRDRLLQGDIAQAFFDRVLVQARINRLLSNEHFTVDGTLIEAWASHKSYRPKDGGDDDGGENFHGEQRSRDTHESTTDPDARLFRKGRGKEAKLAYMGHVLMENRNGRSSRGHARHRQSRTRSGATDGEESQAAPNGDSRS